LHRPSPFEDFGKANQTPPVAVVVVAAAVVVADADAVLELRLSSPHHLVHPSVEVHRLSPYRRRNLWHLRVGVLGVPEVEVLDVGVDVAFVAAVFFGVPAKSANAPQNHRVQSDLRLNPDR